MSRFDDEAGSWDTPEKQEWARKIAALIRERLPKKNDLKAFESGCGTGLLSFALKDRFAKIMLTDVSSGMLDVLKSKIEASEATNMSFELIDLTSQSIPPEKYDVVYTMMALHHVKNTKKIMDQYFNLLLPGGKLFVADLDTEDGSFHSRSVKDIYLGFDRKQIGALAKATGFNKVDFVTGYEMDHTNDDGVKGHFSVFLMTAEK